MIAAQADTGGGGSSLASLEKVEWAANTKINEAGSAISKSLDSAVGDMGSEPALVNINGYDTVGIDSKQIPDMKMAVTTYVNSIDAILDGIKTKTDTSLAFKGEYAGAVTAFTEAIKTACSALTNNLLHFNDQLDKVAAAYAQKDTSMSSQIGDTSTSLNSAISSNTYGSETN